VKLAELILRYAWVMFILITCANAAIWAKRSRPHIARNPELAPGYRKLIRGLLLYGNLPWVVMGIGILFGGVATVFDFLDPRSGIFALVLLGVIVVLWVLGTYWLLFAGGAEELIRYPGLMQEPIHRPWIIKAWWLLCLSGGIAGLWEALRLGARVH
jgi:hypothetical protein